MVTRNIVRFFAAILLLAAIVLYIGWHRDQVRYGPVAQPITCVNNLKQIGLAFRQWALDNGDQFPFNVATNAGGTMEFCAVGQDGFDDNAFRHLRVMSDELNTPKVLVCPKDRARKPATDFSSLQAANVTYRLRSGTNLADIHPSEVLAVCPVDGNTLYCGGSVKEAKGQ